MTDDSKKISALDRQEARRAASEWFAYLHSGDISEDGRARFEAWLHASSEHARQFRRAEQNFRDLALVDAEHPLIGHASLNKASAAPNVVTPRFRTRTAALVGGVIAACLILVASVSVLLNQGGVPTEALYADYSTAVGEIKTVTLDDGSLVTLDTASEIHVAMDDSRRQVVLDAGRAYFDVARDPSRSFVVNGGLGKARAVGTEFTVSRLDGLSVAVFEGSVEVSSDESQPSETGSAASFVLQAGERVVRQSAQSGLHKETFEIDAQRNWLTGRLSYLDQPLSVVVQDVNRYRNDPIWIGDEDLQNLPVTMSLRVDQTDQFISGLEATQPIRAEQDGHGVTLLPKDRD